jgi:hypothetical protein
VRTCHNTRCETECVHCHFTTSVRESICSCVYTLLYASVDANVDTCVSMFRSFPTRTCVRVCVCVCVCIMLAYVRVSLLTYRSLVVMLYMHANYIHMFVAHDTVVTFLDDIYRYTKAIYTHPSILRCTLVVEFCLRLSCACILVSTMVMRKRDF